MVEEDGSIRDLQFELQSAVTRVVETNHTAALRHVTEHRGKKRQVGQELYSSFDENYKNFSAVFYLAPARKCKPGAASANNEEDVEGRLESGFPSKFKAYVS